MNMNLSTVSQFSEDEARRYFEKIRWPNGRFCPHCGADGSYEIGRRKRSVRHERSHRDGLYKCEDCGEQFTAMVGTILEQSHLPIRLWLMAFALMCSSKKGVSALQLQRQLGIGSYRSAWHMCHRIRHAMDKEPMKGLLGVGGGSVQVDEAYIGGKPRKGSSSGKPRYGRSTEKQPIVALVEKGGRVRSHMIARPDAKTLREAIRKHVDKSATIHTDEWSAYHGIGKDFAGGHQTVNHSSGEYARDGVTTNEAEAFFALLKRGIYGQFHNVSRKHLNRYINEFSFRWDRRKMSDAERTIEAIQSGEGKRLRYRDPVARKAHS
jgi:transposase-like protein